MKKGMKSKGYAKGGAKMMKAKSGKMMKAMGGKMAKGYAKGGAKKVMTASMGMAAMRSAAKEKGYKLVKMEDSSFMKRRKNLGGLKKKKS
tara:strand:- start:234 stop:503 length:270 start_codon:yes stop_codon:yes gene_type:complete